MFCEGVAYTSLVKAAIPGYSVTLNKRISGDHQKLTATVTSSLTDLAAQLVNKFDIL